MGCKICRLKNKELLRELESHLEQSKGILSEPAKIKLLEKYPEEADIVSNLSEDDCSIHFNFHMAPSYDISITDVSEEETPRESLTKDINKDEASVLFDLAKKQSATFNLITNKLNKGLQGSEDLTELAMPTSFLVLYRETADSIRSTFKLIKEMNADINGSKSGSLEGLKALAKALRPADESDDADESNLKGKKDLTTDQYDY